MAPSHRSVLVSLAGLLALTTSALAQDAQPSSSVSLGAQAQGTPPNAQVDANATVGTMVDTETPPSAQTEAQAAAPDATGATTEEEAPTPVPWALRNRSYNSWQGSTGSLFLEDPGFGEPGALRIQLAIDSFSGDDFLREDDEVEQNRQTLSVSWTALGMLEFFASVHNRGTVASKPEPTSLHAIGDTLIGFKVFGELAPILRMGGSARLFILNDVGSQETLFSASGIGLRADLALDFSRLDSPVPLIGRFNFDYYFDNSAQVIEDIEDRQYDLLEDPLPENDEPRHLITRAERFGLGINRVDMFTMAAGVELPLELTEDVYLHPMVDFRLGFPVNRQDYDCPFFSSDDNRGTIDSPDDTCLEDESIVLTNLAVGARIVPPIRGVSAVLGVDLGLGGSSTFVRELSPNPPYRVLVALSYDYDAKPAEPVVAAPPPVAPAPPTGRVMGSVVDQTSGSPVAGAVVTFIEKPVTALSTDAAGRFTSYEFEAGMIAIEVSHPDYETRRCDASIPGTGGDVEVACSLAPLPQGGSIEGTLVDQYGAAIPNANIQLTGPKSASLTSDSAGKFRELDMPAGEYTARIVAAGHLIRVARFEVAARQETKLQLAVATRPEKSSVSRRRNQLKVADLGFADDSVELTAKGAQAVAELADLLLQSPEIRRIRIQGDGGEGMALSRALAIKQRLVDAGVPDTRLEAVSEPARSVTITVIE